jgi:hypothetical protein
VHRAQMELGSVHRPRAGPSKLGTSMRPLNRILAAAGVVIAMALPASAAMAAPAQVTRDGATGGYLTSCTGEVVDINGTYHEVRHATADGSVTFHVSIKATGVGNKGNVYVVNDNGWTKFNADGSVSAQDHFRMITKGSAQNQLQFVKFTILPSGELKLTEKSVCVG